MILYKKQRRCLPLSCRRGKGEDLPEHEASKRHKKLYIVRSDIIYLRNVRLWGASLTLKALRDALTRAFSFVIRPMQESCQASNINTIPSTKTESLKRHIPKYFWLSASPANQRRPRVARKLVWCCGTKLAGQLL